jgi:hypothetical protein
MAGQEESLNCRYRNNDQKNRKVVAAAVPEPFPQEKRGDENDEWSRESAAQNDGNIRKDLQRNTPVLCFGLLTLRHSQ